MPLTTKKSKEIGKKLEGSSGIVTSFTGLPTWVSPVTRQGVSALQALARPDLYPTEEFEKLTPTQQSQEISGFEKNKIYPNDRLAPFGELQKQIFGEKGLGYQELNRNYYGNNSYGQEALDSLKGNLNERVAPNISRYLQEGAADPFKAAEAYVTEHSPGVLKRMAEQSARNLNEHLLPALNDDFFSGRSYGSSRHNKFKQRLLRDTAEELQKNQSLYLDKFRQDALRAAEGSANRQLAAGSLYGQTAGQDLTRSQQIANSLTDTVNKQQASNQQNLALGTQLGGQQQHQVQQGMNVAHQNWQSQLNSPYEDISRVQSLVNNAPMPTQNTTIQNPQLYHQASPYTQMGGLLAGLGGNMMGQKTYATGGHVKHFADGGPATDAGVQQTFYLGQPSGSTGSNPMVSPQNMYNKQPITTQPSPYSMPVTPSYSGMASTPGWLSQYSAQPMNSPSMPMNSPYSTNAMPLNVPVGNTEAPNMYAKGGSVHHIRHYAQGGGVPESPIHRGVNDALDSAELQHVREEAMRLREEPKNALGQAIARAGFNIAANRKPGVLAAIGEGANAGMDEYNSQMAQHGAGRLESAKLMQLIDNTRRHQAEINQQYAHKANELSLDEKYKMGDLDIKRQELALKREELSKKKDSDDSERRNKVLGKIDENELEDARTGAKASNDILETIKTMKTLLPEIGITGPVFGVLPDRISTFNNLKGDIDKRQTFRSLSAQLVADVTKNLKGAQSDNDMDLWKSSVAGMEKGEGANQLILDLGEKIAKRSIQYDEYMRKNLENGNSLYETKAKWQKMVNANPLATPKIKENEEQKKREEKIRLLEEALSVHNIGY